MRAIVHGDDGPIQEVEVYKQDLEGDERWRPLLLMKPSRGTVQTNIKATP